MIDTALMRACGALAPLLARIRERPGHRGDNQVLLVEHRLVPPSQLSLTMTHPVHATGPSKRVCTMPDYFLYTVHCNFHITQGSLEALEEENSRNRSERSERIRMAKQCG